MSRGLFTVGLRCKLSFVLSGEQSPVALLLFYFAIPGRGATFITIDRRGGTSPALRYVGFR